MNTTNEFRVHDVESFPVVWSRREAIESGYSAQWEREMNALLARTRPFVIVMEENQPQETHEDRKTRGLWLKQNKIVLGNWCKAVIAIETHAFKRAKIEAQTALASRAFGVKMEVAASQDAALVRARELLGHRC